MRFDETLTWEGPFGWKEAYSVPASFQPGIYVLAVPFESAYLTYYLGESGKSMRSRLKSHEAMYWSGEFSLRDWEAFYAGVDRLFRPSSYRKYSKEARAQFKRERSTWEPLIRAEIDMQRVFLLPIPQWAGPEFRSLRMRLEQALGEGFANCYPANTPCWFAPYGEWKRRNHEDKHTARLAHHPKLIGSPSAISF